MQVPRCFRPRGSLSRIPGSRGLVGGPLPTPWRKPRCRKYPLPRTPRYRRRLRILAAPLSSHPPPLPCGVLLQQGYVENIMDPPLFRQFEFVGLATHRVQNSKKPKKLRLQLPIAFGFDIFAIQPNLLAKSVTSRLSSFIVGLFLQFLNVL